MPMPKHKTELTTWQVFRQGEEISQPEIDPPTSSLRFEYEALHLIHNTFHSTFDWPNHLKKRVTGDWCIKFWGPY